MVSISTKLALNKRTLSKNPFPLAGMKHSIKNPFPLLGIEKMEGNWFTSNLKNCVYQQEKAPNKSTKFIINRKSIFTSQNEGFLEK